MRLRIPLEGSDTFLKQEECTVKHQLQRTQHKFIFILFIISLVVLAVSSSVAAHFTGYNTMLTGQEFVELDRWSIDSGDSAPFPAQLSYGGDGRHTLILRMPENAPAKVDPVLFLVTNHMDLEATLDGRSLYRYAPDLQLSKTSGNALHMIPLPDDYAGKELQLHVRLLLGDSISYTMMAPQLGDRASIIFHIYIKDLPLVLLITLTLCFGLVVLFLHIALSRADRPSGELLYIGLFAVIFAGYALCETDCLRLMVSNSYLVYLATFSLLALLPMPVEMVAMASTSPRFARLLRINVYAGFLNFFLQLMLNFLHVLDWREMLVATHLLIGAGIVSILIAVFGSSPADVPGRNRFLLSISPMLVGVATDLLLFYCTVSARNSFFFQLGVFLFVVIHMIFVVQSYFTLYTQKVRTEYYQKMAFTDSMTGLPNRAAYERRLSETDIGTHRTIWCVCADINNLKHANDTYGHACGDTLITGAAEVLRPLAGEGDIFRTGGDEFVLFLYDLEEDQVLAAIGRLDAAVAAYNRSHPLSISLAVGWDRLRPEDGGNLMPLVIRADTRMYDNKKTWKETCGSPSAR